MPQGSVRTLVFSALGALALGACASLPSGGGSENFAANSALAPQMSGSDRRALSAAFVQAMETGETRQWRGGNAVGFVSPGDYSFGNLLADQTRRIPVIRKDIVRDETVETELGQYVLVRNSNIRLGPGTDFAKLQTLSSGEGVEGVGAVIGKPWMLIAKDGVIIGYVHQNLVTKAPGTELELAGGPHRRPALCRSFSQRMNIYSSRDEWEGAACFDGVDWRLSREAPVMGEQGAPLRF